jgi:hypothetical protein
MDQIELSHKIAAKVQEVEAELVAISEVAGAPATQASLPLMTDTVVQMAKLMTRRRTLIECWEMATGKVWHPNE